VKEERLLILSMLKEGKINVEEATELLGALDNDSNDSTNNKGKEDKNKRLSNMTFEEIGQDIGNAISTMVDGLKDMGGSFGLNFNSETITLDLSEDLSSIENPILDLKAINGSINLNTWQKDNISIKLTCEYKNGLLDNDTEFYNFAIEDDKIVFAPTFNKDISVKLDVFLPNKNYKEIVLKTTNGKIQINDVIVDKLDCITNNGSINSNKIIGDQIFMATRNGKIEALDISAVILDLSTSNGRIICDHSDINRATNVSLTTSNGSITSTLEDLVKGAHFDLDTTMGSVNLDLPNMTSINRDQGFAGNKKTIAHNSNYDENGDNLQYNASTSNGSIKIS
jgi:DUF4097 and DUF4098 domain-containing protein YvlB